MTEVEFGSQVLGETRKRIINVTNNGALGTQFIFRKITGIRGVISAVWDVFVHVRFKLLCLVMVREITFTIKVFHVNGSDKRLDNSRILFKTVRNFLK